ncbi:hypothetical protein [Alcanivorax sp. 1008]|uniref:hypothetical protein n=1 Tax=Alcanivorax sp. 1008 TaxID=2816853 RepID=UPI001E34405C|nr:hypothetical protein [Alcanivorax sp. 1008]
MSDIDFSEANEPLRPLAEIFEPDPRHRHITLEQWYEAIDRARISPAAPKDVKQMFENARIAAVYTYFAYRAHHGFQLLAYGALEEALRLKYDLMAHELPVRKPRTLEEFMSLALAQGWITNQGYRSHYDLAFHRAQMKLLYRDLESGSDAYGIRVVREPTHQEVIAELDEMNLAPSKLQAGRKIRNILAHGSSATWPGALATLDTVAEEINQLFPFPVPSKD